MLQNSLSFAYYAFPLPIVNSKVTMLARSAQSAMRLESKYHQSEVKLRFLLATVAETRSEKQWWWQHSLDFGFGVFFSELSYPDLLRFHFWSQFVSLWTRTWFSKECPLSGIDRDDHWPVHHHHHHHHGCCRCIQIVLLALVLVIIIYVIFYI